VRNAPAHIETEDSLKDYVDTYLAPPKSSASPVGGVCGSSDIDLNPATGGVHTQSRNQNGSQT
jgi:hypothetical protein